MAFQQDTFQFGSYLMVPLPITAYEVVVSDIRVATYNAVANTDTDIVLNASGLNPSMCSPSWAQRQTPPIQSSITVQLVATVSGFQVFGNFVIPTTSLPTTGCFDLNTFQSNKFLTSSPDSPPLGIGKEYTVIVTETRLAIYRVCADSMDDLTDTIALLNPYNRTFPSNVKILSKITPINTRVLEIIRSDGSQIPFA